MEHKLAFAVIVQQPDWPDDFSVSGWRPGDPPDVSMDWNCSADVCVQVLRTPATPMRWATSLVSSTVVNITKFYAQLLIVQIQKMQKTTNDLTVFLHFWDLRM